MSTGNDIVDSYEQDIIALLGRRQVPPIINQNDQHIPKCPGLNKVSGRNYKWIVPHGSTPEDETYCEACSNKLGITGDIHRPLSNSQCNCDGFMKLNNIDNGIFNISLWEPNLESFFHTDAIDENLYRVVVPSGQRFSIMIHTYNKKNQAFRYEVFYQKKGCDELISYGSESKIYTLHSSFVTNPKGSKKINFAYVDSDNKGWDILDKIDREETVNGLNNTLIKPGDRICIKLHIYDIVKHDFMKDSYKNIGNYSLTNNKTIIPKSSPCLALEQHSYDSKSYMTFARTDHVLFTKKPLEFNIEFATDKTKPDSSDILLNSAITKLVVKKSSLVNTMKHNLMTSEKELQETIDRHENLKQELSDISLNMDALQSFVSQ